MRCPRTTLGPARALVGLALPAFLVTGVIDGRAGVADLLRRSSRWRFGPAWWLLAVLVVPVGVLLLGVALFGHVPSEAGTTTWLRLLSAYLVELGIALVTVQLCEEIGWTGFAQDRLQAHHGALRAGLLVAPAFALIHLPTYVVGAPITGETALRLLGGMVAVTLFAIVFRLLLAWTYNGAGRSVLAAALLHASFNTVSGAAFLAPFGSRPEAGLLPLAVVAALAALGVIVTRGRLAFRP
jgi:membrane protease YdiL (CAAX protease family)